MNALPHLSGAPLEEQTAIGDNTSFTVVTNPESTENDRDILHIPMNKFISSNKSDIEDPDSGKPILLSRCADVNAVLDEAIGGQYPGSSPGGSPNWKNGNIVVKNITVDKDLNVTGSAYIKRTLNVYSDAVISDGLEVDGYTLIDADLKVNEKLTVDSDATVGKSLTVDGWTSLPGGMETGQADIEKLNVTDKATIDGTLTVNNRAVIDELEVDDLVVVEDAEISGDLTVNNGITADSVIADNLVKGWAQFYKNNSGNIEFKAKSSTVTIKDGTTYQCSAAHVSIGLAQDVTYVNNSTQTSAEFVINDLAKDMSTKSAGLVLFF